MVTISKIITNIITIVALLYINRRTTYTQHIHNMRAYMLLLYI